MGLAREIVSNMHLNRLLRRDERFHTKPFGIFQNIDFGSKHTVINDCTSTCVREFINRADSSELSWPGVIVCGGAEAVKTEDMSAIMKYGDVILYGAFGDKIKYKFGAEAVVVDDVVGAAHIARLISRSRPIVFSPIHKNKLAVEEANKFIETLRYFW